MGNSRFMVKVRNILECGLDSDNGMYFGDMLHVKETANGICVKEIGKGTYWNSNSRERNPERSTIHVQEGLIPIQLDDLTKEKLLQKTGSVAKKWSSWVLVDVRDRMMMNVTWRAVSSGIQRTRMDCVMCRSDQGKRCRHELVREKESELEINTQNANRQSEEHGAVEDDVPDVIPEVVPDNLNAARTGAMGSGNPAAVNDDADSSME